jgi:hypothetical protein
MDSSERLRRDQEELNRRRDNRTYDRRGFIESLRTQGRIDALTARIEAQRKKRSDDAFEDMWAQWPKTRAVIERGTAVTPLLQKKWVERLEVIKTSGKWSAAERLDELKGEVNGIAEGVSQLSADLRKAAGCRRPSELPQILPTVAITEQLRHAAVRRRYPPADSSDPALLLSRLLPRWFDQPLTRLLAEDLQPIFNQLLLTDYLPAEVRFAWIDQLKQIDQPGPWTRASSAEMAETLAAVIEAVAADIRSVGAAVGYQAEKCRSYWVTP